MLHRSVEILSLPLNILYSFGPKPSNTNVGRWCSSPMSKALDWNLGDLGSVSSFAPDLLSDLRQATLPLFSFCNMGQMIPLCFLKCSEVNGWKWLIQSLSPLTSIGCRSGHRRAKYYKLHMWAVSVSTIFLHVMSFFLGVCLPRFLVLVLQITRLKIPLVSSCCRSFDFNKF